MKYSFTEIDPKIAIELMKKNKEPVKLFVVDDDTVLELWEALKKAAEMLRGAHFGIRHELCDGW